jgi:hypothetical protein
MNVGAVLTPVRHPWLARLAVDPERAVDSVLRGVAHRRQIAQQRH